MAIARIKRWIFEILQPADLNAEFDNIINNGTDVAFPLTKNVDFNTFGASNVGNLAMTSGKSLTMTSGQIIEARGSSLASASTVNLASATGNLVHITGTTTITSFGSAPAGFTMRVVFDGSLTLTHNAVSLILPGSANIPTSAGDACIAVSEGVGNWRVLLYQKFNGTAINPAATPSPLTTPGDLFGRTASGDARVPVGSNGQILVADSTQAAGVKWTGVGARGFPRFYNTTFGTQTFAVPANVYEMLVELYAGGGGGGAVGASLTCAGQDGGNGNYVAAVIPVSPGQVYFFTPGTGGGGGIGSDGSHGSDAYFGDQNTYAGSTNAILALSGSGGARGSASANPITTARLLFDFQNSAGAAKGAWSPIIVHGRGASGGNGGGSAGGTNNGAQGGLGAIVIWY